MVHNKKTTSLHVEIIESQVRVRLDPSQTPVDSLYLHHGEGSVDLFDPDQ